MNAGQLRHVLSFRAPTPTPDSLGDDKARYDDVTITTWGAVEALRGDEPWIASMLRASVNYSIEMRYREDVKSNMRCEWKMANGTRRFELRGPPFDPDGRMRRLMFAAVEVK